MLHRTLRDHPLSTRHSVGHHDAAPASDPDRPIKSQTLITPLSCIAQVSCAERYHGDDAKVNDLIHPAFWRKPLRAWAPSRSRTEEPDDDWCPQSGRESRQEDGHRPSERG
jgi:hypothetical protein